MSMWLGAIPTGIVYMLMMLVMPVGVAMDHRIVPVGVIMAFGSMKPDANRHQRRRHPE